MLPKVSVIVSRTSARNSSAEDFGSPERVQMCPYAEYIKRCKHCLCWGPVPSVLEREGFDVHLKIRQSQRVHEDEPLRSP